MKQRRVKALPKAIGQRWSGLIVKTLDGVARARPASKPPIKVKTQAEQHEEFDTAFDSVARKHVLESELAKDLKPHVRKNHEAEIRSIHNWFTPRQRRPAIAWQR